MKLGLARVRRVRRLHEVRPHEVSRLLEAGLKKFRKRIDGWLVMTNEKDNDGNKMTSLGAAMVRLTKYAQGDGDAGEDTELGSVKSLQSREAVKLARRILADMLSSQVVSISADGRGFEKMDPYFSELTVICCAVLGRYRIEVEKGPIPDAWLAAMASIKTGSVRTYLCLFDKPTVLLERPKHANGAGLITYQSAKKLLERRDLV